MSHDDAKKTVHTPNILWLDGEDPEMVAAIREAQRAFGHYRDQLERDASAVEDCGVKVFFLSPTDPRAGEHMWVNDVVFGADGMEATLCDDPGWLRGPVDGDRVAFTLDRVSDWFFVAKGVVHGGFTIRVLLRHLTAEQFAEHRDGVPVCYFADWYAAQQRKPAD